MHSGGGGAPQLERVIEWLLEKRGMEVEGLRRGKGSIRGKGGIATAKKAQTNPEKKI